MTVRIAGIDSTAKTSQRRESRLGGSCKKLTCVTGATRAADVPDG